MGIVNNGEGKAFVPDNAAGYAGMKAASIPNGIGNIFNKNRKTVWVAVGVAGLVAGTLGSLVAAGVEFTKETGKAVAEGTGELLPEVCVGNACVGSNDSETTVTVATSVEGGQANGTPNAGNPSQPDVDVTVGTVIAPAGAGGLALARLCLGLDVNAPLSETVSNQWVAMQQTNAAALADGISKGESFTC